MNRTVNRARLLGSALSAVAGSVAVVGFASPASASCTITTTVNPNDTYSCANTTTTNTTGLSGSDRNIPYTTSGIPLFVTIGSTVTVDGFGLAFTDASPGTNNFAIDNNGAIVVTAGNTPSAGGSNAALFVSSVNTPIFYNGTGSVANNGVGHGVAIVSTGATVTGTIQYVNSGSVSSATGNAVDLSANGGNIFISSLGDLTANGLGGIGLRTDNVNGSTNIILGGLVNADAVGVSVTATGTGIVNVTTNDIVTVANGDGIQVTTGSGTIFVGTDAVNAANGDGVQTVSTSGSQGFSIAGAIDAGGLGINATSSSGNLDFFNNATGTVTSAGDGVALTTGGAGTVNVVQNGVVTSNGGDAIATTTVDGNQTISGTANIVAAVNGIDAAATGLGTVTVTRTGGTITSVGGDGIQVDTAGGNITVTTGAITANGGNGVQTTSTGGNQTITVSGAISASSQSILATSTSGTITVNVNANVTTTGGGDGVSTTTTGLTTVNVAAGRTVTSGGDVINFYGSGATATLNNSGTIGSLVSGVAVYSSSSKPVIVNNLAGGTINGAYDLSSFNDSVVNSGTLNLRGVSNFYAGTDAITNNLGGTINVAAGTTVTGLETLTNAGTLAATSGIIFDAGGTALVNTGTINAGGTFNFGAGVDSFSNNLGGTVNLAAGTTFDGLETFTNNGTANATGTITFVGVATPFNNGGTLITTGATTLAGIGSLNNSGTIDLDPGVFAVAGPFINSGTILADEGASTISGQTSFSNSGTIDLQDGLANDTLTIASSFSGTGGSDLLLDVDDNGSDQLIITGAASGSTAISANLIGTGILNADGVLLVDAASASNGAFVLGNVTGNTNPLLDYSLLQNGGDFLLITSINEAGFAPVAVTMIASDVWYQSAEAVWAQSKLPSDGTNRMGVWGQVYAGREKAGNRDRQTINGLDYDVNNRIESDRLGFQAGYGFPMGGMGSLGVTAGFSRADVTGAVSDYDTKGFNLGAYGTFGGPVGFHGAFLAKHDRFSVDIDRSVFGDASPDGRSNGIDGELGYRFAGTSGPAFGVSAGLSHVRTKLDDFTVAGLNYDYDNISSTRGRVGVRATGNGPISPFFDARVYHEFSGDGDLDLGDGIDAYRLRADGRGTWARFEAGVGGPASGLAPMVSAWIDIGDVKGFGGRGSFRF